MNKFDYFAIALLTHDIAPAFIDKILALPFIKLQVNTHQEFGPSSMAEQCMLVEKGHPAPEWLTEAGWEN